MKSAFTLAEVLITLGIIGVVAAMTIPTLISKYQKRAMEVKLKENYSIFSQVTRRMINDDIPLNFEEADYDAESIKVWFEENMLPYMHVSSICYYDSPGCWGSIVSKLDGTEYYDCHSYGCGMDALSFIMNNGSTVSLDVGNNEQLVSVFGGGSTAQTFLKIFVDLNGVKKPNILGKDVFLMYMTEDGFRPAGSEKTYNEQVKDCSKDSMGYWCMSLVKNNGWIIPDDVWKN